MTNRGFTLIEVMISLLLFAACAVAFMGFYVGAGRLAESARNLTQAVNDARVVMEAIRDTAQASGLTGATGVTGVYPQGTNLAGQLALGALPAENVTVTYANPGADPLPVTVQVQWDESGRARTATVDTMVTRR